LDASKILRMDLSSQALYSASDYWADNPSTSAREKLAKAEEFKTLVKELHRQGIEVILDVAVPS
jgi:pullulanase/glycogen debranching enzyme